MRPVFGCCNPGKLVHTTKQSPAGAIQGVGEHMAITFLESPRRGSIEGWCSGFPACLQQAGVQIWNYTAMPEIDIGIKKNSTK